MNPPSDHHVEPTKAYYVERIARTVTTLRVYADSADDAKKRSAMEGEAIDSEHEGRGFGRVRREPMEDR